MRTYIFILGRDPELSKKELFSYLEARKINYSTKEQSESVLVLTLEKIIPEEMINDLGGTQKIAECITSFENFYTGTENKVRYAISKYGEEEENDIKEQLKNYFKRENIKTTIKKSHHEDQEYLTPSEAQNVLEIIQYKGYSAKTQAVFNPQEYKFRDLKRPAQRPLHTISIRLAKILINLTGAKQQETILDPFCGIGTIPQEALLMHMNVIGIEKEKAYIEASKKNLDWIRDQYHCRGAYRLIQTDARQVGKYLTNVDAVATEPYLGPFLKKYPSDAQAKRIVNELLPLYQEVLFSLLKITKKKIVFITPRFKTKEKREVSVLLEPFLQKKGVSFEGPYLYTTPSAKILREIWILGRSA